MQTTCSPYLECVCAWSYKTSPGSFIHGLPTETGAAVGLDCDHLACHCRVGPLVPAMVKQPQTVQLACTAQYLEHSRQGTVQGKRPLPKAPATPVRQAQLPMVPLANSRQATAEHRYVSRASRHAVHVVLHPLLQKCITSSGRAGVQHWMGVAASMPCNVSCMFNPCQQAAFWYLAGRSSLCAVHMLLSIPLPGFCDVQQQI